MERKNLPRMTTLKMLEELPPDMGVVKTPTTNYLFNTNRESKKLSEEKGSLFHHLVA